jgi:hypothetical protein
MVLLLAGLVIVLVLSSGRFIERHGDQIRGDLTSIGPFEMHLPEPTGDALRGVSFGDFTMRLKSGERERKLLEARGAKLRFDVLEMLRGRLEVGEIILDRPFLTMLRGQREEASEILKIAAPPDRELPDLRLKITDGSFRLVESLRGADSGRSLGFDHINLDARIEDDRIDISRLDFTFLRRTWIVRGEIFPRDPERNSLNVDLARIEPRELMNGLKRFFANSPNFRPEGGVRLFLKVTGPFSDPLIEGEMTGESLTFGVIRLDDPRADLLYRDGTLSLNGVRAGLLGGRLEGDFELKPQLHDSPFHFAGALRGADFPRLFELLPGVTDLARGSFDAEELRLTGRIDASENYSVSTTLRSRRGEYLLPLKGKSSFQRFHELSARVEILPDRLMIWDFILDSRTLDLVAEGIFRQPLTWELHGVGALDKDTAESIPSFPFHAPEAVDKGKVHFRWEWESSPENPAGPFLTPQPARSIAPSLE